MAINEQASASVHLDGQQAQEQLRQLKEQAAAMRKELKEMKLADDPGYAKKKREMSSLDAEIKKLNKGSFDLNNTLKNLSGASMKDLTRAQQVLTAQIRQTSRSTAEGRAAWSQKSEQLRKVRGELSLMRTQMGAVSQNMGIMQRMAQGFNRYFGMMGATIASVGGIIMGLRKTIQVFNDYEESVANLSAITGVAGEQLEWYSERAKEASVATTEHGIRFANSAKDIVDAYTMVGSKRPELLANREALASVTEQAMILSKAAKIELEPAATALTTTMNQFNLSADQASRVINILGAGSKVGAGNVAYLNDVVEKTGTSARSANLTVEQLIGTIEGIAPKFSQPAEAGTSLRNVFLRLQALDDDLNPTIVGWEKSLENLAARQYSAAEITQIFGLRAVNMVQALIDGREDINRFTEAVTGSSVAIEQASINSETNAAKLEQARNRAQLLRIELGEKLAPALTFSTNGFSYLLKGIKDVIDNWDKYRQLLIIGIALLLAYNWNNVKATASIIAQNLTLQAGIGLRIREGVVTQAQIIREAALIGWRVKGSIATKAATAAQRIFNAVVMQFPGFAIVGAIMAIVGAIKLWDTHNKAAVEQRKEHNRLLDENNELLQKAKNAQDDASQSLESLNQLTVEDKNALFDRNQEKIRSIEIDLQQMRINQQLAKENASSVSVMQTITSSLKSIVTGKHAVALMAVKSAENMKEAGDEFTDVISDMEAALASIRGTNQELNNIMTAETRANQIVGDSVAALQEKVNLYRLALNHAKIGSDDYNRIKGLLSDTQKELNQAMIEGDDALEGNTQAAEKAKNAYQELTSAISSARSEMQHLIALGDYDGAQAINARVKALEAEKIVLDGIVEAGGDVIAFLDNMADSTQAELEETATFQQQFLDNWKDKSDEWDALKEEKRQAEIDQEIEDHEARLQRQEWEAERELELANQVSDAKQQITDATLSAGFNLFSMYAYAEYDRRMKDLNTHRDRELSNENLTAQQRQSIVERYQKEEAKLKKEAFIRQKRADVLQSVINNALAVSRAIAAPPGFPLNAPSVYLAAALGLIQTATIAAQPVPQFYSGRYPVKGATDGRTYMASIAGDPVTGIYPRPALISERGEELIVDAPTTRNIRLNYPHLLDAIMAVRVPQFASGRYLDPATPQTSSNNVSQLAEMQTQNMILQNRANEVLSLLEQRLQSPIKADVSLLGSSGLRAKEDELKQLKKNAYN